MKALKILLLLLVISSSSCINEENLQAYHTLTIKEGKHRATPYDLNWSNDGTHLYEWQFNHTARYELGDNDQCDWNKLTGVSTDLLQTRENSMIIAWRYDRLDSLVLSIYYHYEGGTFWASAPCTSPTVEALQVDTDLPHLTISLVEPFRTTTKVNNNTITITVETIFTQQSISYTREFDNFGRNREIYPWFGGNKSAPHDIRIGRRLIR